jgi:hypothetical protein
LTSDPFQFILLNDPLISFIVKWSLQKLKGQNFVTGESVTTITTESKLVLEDLYPGAGYEVKVFAISHGLRSEPHDYFQAVCEYALLL